jgi:two-component sensor histidine kinase/ABC-type amino acid transport substrate-binding protein
LLIIFLSLFFFCYSQNRQHSPANPQYIRVGLYNNNPLIYQKESGEVAGFYADILNYIAAQENWEIEFIPGSWQDCLNRLELNQINIMPAIAYSAEREELYDFCRETVITNWAQIFIRKDSDISSYLDLDQKKVGVLSNDIYYHGPKGIENIERSYNLTYNYVEFDSYNAIFSALENGSIEAGILNRLYRIGELSESSIKKTSLIFHPSEIRFAFPKGAQLNQVLIPLIDDWLLTLKENPVSVYYQAQEKYINRQNKSPDQFRKYFIFAIIIFIFGLLLFIILNRYLKQQIKKRSLQLRDSEAKFHDLYNMFRLTIDNVPDMIWAKDLNNNYLFVNRSTCKKLLWANDILEPIGKSDLFFGERQRKLHPDDPNWCNFDEICALSDKQVLKSRISEKFEESVYVNGKYLILDVRKAPFWDDNNQLIGTVGSAREINDQKALEAEKNKTLQELHEREIFNYALFEYNPVETIVVDRNAKVIKVNQAVKTKRSHAPELGNVMYKDFAAKYSIDMHGELLSCIKENKIRYFPEIVYGNGKVFTITFSPFLGGAIITSRDITEEKIAESQLKALNNVFENLGTDPQENIIYITSETNKLLNGVCSLYNRLDEVDQSLCVWAEFNSPDDLQKRDNPEGHICYEATIKGRDKPVIISDLTGTEYEESDPNVKKYGLKSYLGYPVTLQEEAIGSLCVVDIQERKFTDNEVYIISTLAKAISIEEERARSKQYLKNSIFEKEILLKEIHHRVKNNMQIISSLLNLHSKNINDNKIIHLFKESQNRVKTMALIHEKLYAESNFAEIDISSYIRSLANYLFRNFSDLSKNLKLEISTDKIMLDIDSAIPCGLIINELVTNSIKYAFPDKDNGTIMITFKHENEKNILIIKDNGIGLPAEFDLDNILTLGYDLVKALTDQLHGSLEIKRSAGTEVVLTF